MGAQEEPGWGRGGARQGFPHQDSPPRCRDAGKGCLGLGQGKSYQGGWLELLST